MRDAITVKVSLVDEGFDVQINLIGWSPTQVEETISALKNSTHLSRRLAADMEHAITIPEEGGRMAEKPQETDYTTEEGKSKQTNDIISADTVKEMAEEREKDEDDTDDEES